MSDYTELVESHGMSAGDANAIDKLIDMYSDEEEDYSDRPKCIVCGKPCPPHDSGFIFDAGHTEYFTMLGISPDEYDPAIHPQQIDVPLHGGCWERSQWSIVHKELLPMAMREWYQAQVNKEE